MAPIIASAEAGVSGARRAGPLLGIKGIIRRFRPPKLFCRAGLFGTCIERMSDRWAAALG